MPLVLMLAPWVLFLAIAIIVNVIRLTLQLFSRSRAVIEEADTGLPVVVLVHGTWARNAAWTRAAIFPPHGTYNQQPDYKPH